jgi:hypothetical protein
MELWASIVDLCTKLVIGCEVKLRTFVIPELGDPEQSVGCGWLTGSDHPRYHQEFTGVKHLMAFNWNRE